MPLLCEELLASTRFRHGYQMIKIPIPLLLFNLRPMSARLATINSYLWILKSDESLNTASLSLNKKLEKL